MITITDNPIVINCGEFARRCEEMDPLTHLLLALSSCIAKNLRKYYIITGVRDSKCDIDISFKDQEFLIEFKVKNEKDMDFINTFIKTITVTDPCTMVKMISTPKRFVAFLMEN